MKIIDDLKKFIITKLGGHNDHAYWESALTESNYYISLCEAKLETIYYALGVRNSSRMDTRSQGSAMRNIARLKLKTKCNKKIQSKRNSK